MSLSNRESRIRKGAASIFVLNDGDGSVGWRLRKRRGKQVFLSLIGGKQIVAEFLKFAQEICPSIHGAPRKKRRCWTFDLEAKQARTVIRALYQDATFYLDRKMAIARQIMDAPEPVIGRPPVPSSPNRV